MEMPGGSMEQTPVKRKRTCDGSGGKEGDVDDIPLKKTKSESLTAAECYEEDATVGNKIAETNLVVSISTEVLNDFNNFTDVKSETESGEDEEKILETSEEHKIYETECSIIEIATNEERSEKYIPQKKTRSESCVCVAIDRDDNATLEVSLRSRDIEHLNNLADIQNETVTHDDDKKICNETELFSITKIETNGSLDAERTEISFAQNEFQECCENSSQPDVSSDTKDITDLFESKEIKFAEPNKVDDVNVQDAENEYKVLSSDKDIENVEESTNPENVNDNDDTKEFGNGHDDVQVAVETHGQYLYRMLRPGEDHENGITPKNINSTTSINDHVAYGSSSCQTSKYISCTKSKEKVFKFASIIRKNERYLKRTIIRIDKSKLGCNVEIVDLTDTSNQVLLVDAIAKKRALRFDEVLLVPEVDIPADSITAIAHIQNGSVTHYS